MHFTDMIMFNMRFVKHPRVRPAKLGALLGVALACAAHGSERGHIHPGIPWADTDGLHINAHGFCVIQHEGGYIWYGSRKIPGLTESEKNEAGVSCYSSDDLLTWKNHGLVFSISAEGQHPDIAKAGILDRPKVFFNPAAGKFVMHFKLYPPHAAGDTKGTDIAYVGTASSTDPLGPFKYEGKYTGGGSPNGTGDFGIYQDEKGSFWHVAVRKPDKALVIGKLREDGLRPKGEYTVMEGVERATEAPAMFRRGGKIHLLASGSTGWAPNPARMFVADRPEGPYTSLGNPCQGTNPHNKLGPEKAFGGQSTFVMPMPGNGGQWIAMFDIWNPNDPVNAGYIWLPVDFEKDKPVIRWQDKWTPPISNPNPES
jgi:Glycosyl hydrolases family 43